MIVFALSLSLLHSILSAGAPVASNPAATISAREDPLLHTTDRSLIQIIWTCAAIIFASSWVCIHPHIPGYGSTRLQRWGIRLRLFVNALLFPDQFVGRAYYEWEGSKALYAEMNRRLDDIRKKRSKDVKISPRERLKRLGNAILEFVEETATADRPSPEEVGLGKEGEQAVEGVGPGQTRGTGERGEGGAQPCLDSQQSEGKVAKVGNEELRAKRRDLEVEWTRVQRLMARELGEQETEPIFPALGEREWTMVHAHYIHMGGVVFQEPDNSKRFKDFRKWTDEDIEAFFALRLSKDKIQDCSKADGLAKAFVIIQCLWFVVQCIGRAAYGLLLIQLEVTCLAYIACNIGMYWFWWYKPLNVSCPERIQSQRDPQPAASAAPDPGPKAAPDHEPEIGPNANHATATGLPWYMVIFDTLVTGDIGLLIFPSRGWDTDIVDPSETRFPVNYYYKHSGWNKYAEPLGQTVPLAIFGALHAIAWHGSFPTLAEKILWRSSSIAPAILALILLAYFMVLQTGLNNPDKRHIPLWAEKLLEGVVCFTIIVSFASRIGFIVQPLFQLRDLPPLAFQTVEWTDALPHV